MPSIGIRVRCALFGLSRREALFERRGFPDTAVERRLELEAVGGSFIDGYNAWLARGLADALRVVPRELRGFAVEGAAMASALLDHLTPWRSGRWAHLLQDHPDHVYMIHVGAGWAAARLHRSLARAVARRDPLLGWLVADGWGFHQAYFHPAAWATGRKRVTAGPAYLGRAVDQGIGRALWFVGGADPAQVARRIARFAPGRHADLWSGAGLAATYAGGCAPGELTALVELAGGLHPQLAQGAAFAATARQVAGNLTAQTEAAALAITGRTAGELAALAEQLRPTVPRHDDGGSYERWRSGLAGALVARKAA